MWWFRYDHSMFKQLREIRKDIGKVMSQVSVFATAVQKSFDAVTASLDNIVSDEASLAKQISDLQAQIAAGGSNLTAEDQAALDAVSVKADALAARTKAVSDAVPDLPVPPTL